MNTVERIVIDRRRDFEIFERDGQIWITVEDGPDHISVDLTPDQAKQLEKAIAGAIARMSVSQ